MNILVLMTQNVSLKEWNKKKILSRELLIYKKLSQKVDNIFSLHGEIPQIKNIYQKVVILS